MSIRRVAKFILPVLVFGTGLLVGATLSIKKRATDFSAAVERRLASNNAEAGTARKSSPLDPSSRFATEANLITAIMSAVTEKDPLLRAHQLRELIGHLNSTQLASIFERATKISDYEVRIQLLAPVLARWVEIDQPAAMAALKPYRDRLRSTWRVPWGGVEYSVNEALAKALPRLALAEAAVAPDSWWAASNVRLALAELANDDPAKKLSELAKIPGGKLRDDLCQSILLDLAKKDFAAAEAQLDLINDPKKRSRAQTTLLETLAEKDPAAAIDRVCELTKDNKQGSFGIDLASKVLRACARQNTSEALASIERLPSGLQSYACGAVLVGWAEKEPIEALEWAVANNMNIRQTKAIVEIGEGGFGWNSLIMTAFDNDLEKTLAWLRSQPPSPDRDSLLRSGIMRGTLEQRMAIYADLAPDSRPQAVKEIVGAYQGSGVSKMDKWVHSLPEGRERVAGIQALAALQANNDPDAIESITSAWPAGPERDAAFKGVVSSIADDDPVRGLELARQITDPKSRSHAFFNLAWSWFYEDKAGARSWVSGTAELTAEEKRVLIRQFDES